MLDFSDAAVLEHYKNLQPEIKSQIFSDDKNEAVFLICSQRHLSLDQMNLCADEVDLFLLGMTPPETFPKKLAARLELSPDVGNHIVAELVSKVFAPLKDPLKNLYKVPEIVFPSLTPPQPNQAQKKNIPEGTALAAPITETPPPQKTLPAAPNISNTTSSSQPLPPPPKPTSRSIPIVIEKTKPSIDTPAPMPAASLHEAPIQKPVDTPSPQQNSTTPPPPPLKAPAAPSQPQLPSPFVEVLPTATIQAAATPPISPRRPLNWSDIVRNQGKESVEPAIAHSKLEQALNITNPSAPSGPVGQKTYGGKDPYREPIE